MAITYPLVLPTGIVGIRDIVITPSTVVGIDKSPFTLERQVQRFPGQLWKADITLAPMLRPDAEEWISFLLSLEGRLGTFLLGDPNGGTPRGVGTGVPLVDGVQASGLNILNTKGWTTGITGILKKGDYFSLGTGTSTRLYKVIYADVDSDGGGLATLTIWPRLRTPTVDNEPLTINNATSTFALNTNEMPFALDPTLFYTGFNIPAEEAI